MTNLIRFQYVSLQLDALKQANDPKAVGEALIDLPQGLDETYDRTLLSLNENQQVQAIRALKWLAFSLRPLTVGEISEAVIIDTADESSHVFDEKKRFFRPAVVLSLLPGLVVVDQLKHGAMWTSEESEEAKESEEANEFEEAEEAGGLDDHRSIRLAHFSIKEYLISDRIRTRLSKAFAISENDAHLNIACASIIYHLHASEFLSAELDFTLWGHTLPLWTYAALFCFRHLEIVPKPLWTSTISALAIRTLKHQSKSYSLLALTKPNELGIINAPLTYLISIDCLQICSLLLEQKTDDYLNDNLTDALYYACYKAREKPLRFLLHAGADPWLGRKNYCCALQVIIGRNQRFDDGDEAISCMKALLEDPRAFDRCEEIGYQPLIHAFLWDNKEFVELLIQCGAPVNDSTYIQYPGHSPLYIASLGCRSRKG